MVNIIENRSVITGTVKLISEEPDAKGYYLVNVDLITSSDLDELPNLARADEGKLITLKLQKPFFEGRNITTGAEISITVRKAFGQVYFAHEE